MYQPSSYYDYSIFSPDQRLTFGDIVTLQDVVRWRTTDMAWFLGLNVIWGWSSQEHKNVEQPAVCLLSRFLINNSWILKGPISGSPVCHPVDLISVCEAQGIPLDRHKMATLFGKTYNTVCQWYKKLKDVPVEERVISDKFGRDTQRLTELIIHTINTDGVKAFSFWMDLATNEGRLWGNKNASNGLGWELPPELKQKRRGKVKKKA